MELRIVILGLLLLGVHNAVSSFEDDDIPFILDQDGSRQTAVHNFKKAVIRLLRTDKPESIAVTFHDTDIKIWDISIISDNYYGSNDDADVMSMTGLLRALRHSPAERPLWVFTDEPVRDPGKYHEVVYTSQQMSNPIYFAIFGLRNDSMAPAPGFSMYHDLATATNGQVFYLQKNETGELVNYEECLRNRPKDITETFSPDFENNEFNVTVDSKMSELIIAVTGGAEEPAVTLTDPSGHAVATTDVTRLRAITVVKSPVSPGVYKVQVSSRQESRVVVTAFTSLTFRYGFSFRPPSHFNETSRIPEPGIGYISILLDDDEGLQLRTVQILDTESTVLVEIPVESVFSVTDSATPHFYTAGAISMPDFTFQIAINIHNGSSGTYLTRHGSTPVTPSLASKCQQPMDVGPCVAEIPKWYYDNSLKMCRQFAFGGCHGNANNFHSEAECARECAAPGPPEPPTPDVGGDTDKCQLPREVGPCRAMLSRWYYDNSLKMCSPFAFGGCRGNANNFHSEAECARECAAPGPPEPPTPDVGGDTGIVCDGRNDCSVTEASDKQNFTTSSYPPLPRPENAGFPSTDKCQQPREVGPCRGMFSRWYYDNSLKMCSPFAFGGCHGNANNFHSEAECARECAAPGPPEPPTPDVGGDTGIVCDGRNDCSVTEASDEQNCTTSSYPPLPRPENAGFPSTDKCQQPREVGPCRGMFSRWYYDNSLKMCIQFAFGGCHGNANNFHSEAECARECAAPGPPEPPTPDVGGDTGIPPNPASKICAENEFVCSKSLEGGIDPTCIPGSFVCDGDFDCPQGEDEDDDECRNHQCPPDRFRCPSGRCLLQSRVCDGRNDCSVTEASDEQNCTTSSYPPLPRPENAGFPSTDKCQQPMDVGLCRAMLWRWYYDNSLKMCIQFAFGGCHGNANNFHSEAECARECAAPGPPEPPTPDVGGDTGIPPNPASKICAENEFVCSKRLEGGVDPTCIPGSFVCDGDFDCPQGEDEDDDECRNHQCPPDRFRCPSGRCLLQSRVCDGRNDCSVTEASDEQNCTTSPYPPLPRPENAGFPSTAKCQQPKDAGPCFAEIPQWYYDSSFNMCLMFLYSGCGGNDNRFDTDAECSGQCVDRVRINEPPPNTTEQQNRERAATETTPKVPMNETTRDEEFETFGRYVASTLRKFHEKVAINAQDAIQRILSKYKLKNLKKVSS